MSKRMVAIALSLMLAFLACAAPAETGNPNEAYAGFWVDPEYGRATLSIRPLEGRGGEGEYWYDILLHWGASADEAAQWRMTARYNADANALVYESGEMSVLTFDEDGEREDVQWNDATGAFALADDGRLTWVDSNEEVAADFAFEAQPKITPGADELTGRYLDVIAGIEQGTAGGSLKLAARTCETIDYAYGNALWNADGKVLGDNLLSAWEALGADRQANFDENFIDVLNLADAAFDSYGDVAGQFEDAGVGERMAFLAASDEARQSWQMLTGHTLTMGNSDD